MMMFQWNFGPQKPSSTHYTDTQIQTFILNLHAHTHTHTNKLVGYRISFLSANICFSIDQLCVCVHANLKVALCFRSNPFAIGHKNERISLYFFIINSMNSFSAQSHSMHIVYTDSSREKEMMIIKGFVGLSKQCKQVYLHRSCSKIHHHHQIFFLHFA